MVYILIGICLIGVVLFVAFSKKKATQKKQTSIIEGSNSNSMAVATIGSMSI